MKREKKEKESFNIFKALIFPSSIIIKNIITKKKNRAILLLPIALGVIIGFFKSASNYDSNNFEYWAGQLTATILITSFKSLLFIFIYSWFVLFLCYLFKGISNFKIIFSIISYSLIPMIFGGILLIIIFFSTIFILPDNHIIITILFIQNIFQKVLFLYGIIILVRFISVINEFSIFKSIISGTGLLILLLIIGIIRNTIL